LARNCSQQQVVNQPLFKRHGAVLSDPGEFDIDIQIFDADIFRLLKNIPATAEIIKDPLLERILSGFNTGLGTGLEPKSPFPERRSRVGSPTAWALLASPT
jgi:hypothetical protein